MEKEKGFEDFKRELKEIGEKLRELNKRESEVQRDLRTATEQRQKLYGDVALGLRGPGEKARINERIRELEGELEDLDITIKELEERGTRLDRGGYGKFYRH